MSTVQFRPRQYPLGLCRTTAHPVSKALARPGTGPARHWPGKPRLPSQGVAWLWCRPQWRHSSSLPSVIRVSAAVTCAHVCACARVCSDWRGPPGGGWIPRPRHGVVRGQVQ